MQTAILPHPPRVSLLRICEACNRWFALKPVKTTIEPNSTKVLLYRCKHCGKETTFASGHPPHSV